MMKIMIRDKTAQEGIDIFKAAGFEVVVDNEKREVAELCRMMEDVEGLVVRSATKVTAEIINGSPRLKVIGRAGAGVDNIDQAAATARGVVVMNTPGGNTVSTAEHAVAMLMSLARNIPQATASVRAGQWEKSKFRGVELEGKTLGILGLGNIGRVVAERALGLKMKAIAYDPLVTPQAAETLKVEFVSLDDIFARSDFITVHTPRNEDTKNLINSKTMAKMKKGVRIINCARGGIVNEADLYEALKTGQVAGAALDVFESEPPEKSPLLELPNAIFTPHQGANTSEAQVNVAVIVARQMVDYLKNGIITNAVNFPSVSPEELVKVRPYIDLAERMGSMLGQLITRLDGLSIQYRGEISALNTKPVTHAVLKGLLSAFMDVPVNDVNAPLIARQRGIDVSETVSGQVTDYANLIQLSVRGNHTEVLEIAGTLFGHKHPRLVRMDGIYLDAIPEGSILVIRNWDKPGVIGNIGTLLGQKGINIARFHLGRNEGRAVCLVSVDAPAPEEVVKQIAELPNIISVQQIVLDPIA